MADVQADEQGGDLFDDAGVLKFAAIDGAQAGNFTDETAHTFGCFFVIAAHDHVALDRMLEFQEFGLDIVECGDNGHALWHQFCRLLRR